MGRTFVYPARCGILNTTAGRLQKGEGYGNNYDAGEKHI